MSPTPTPPLILSEGPVDLSSFLSQASGNSFANNNNNNNAASTTNSGQAAASSFSHTNSGLGILISSSAVGVVRGRARDHQTSVKERDPGAKQGQVESKMRDSFATLVNKSEQRKADGGAANAKDAGDESAITADKVNANAVTLVAESHVFSTAMKVLKADPKARVLIVTSLEDVTASSNINNHQQKEGEEKIKVGSFCGSEKNIPAGTAAGALSDLRLWYTTFRAMISFLNVFVRDSALACPFTHICLVARDGKCSPLFDATLSVLCSLIFASTAVVSTPSTSLPVSGKTADDEQQQQQQQQQLLPQPKSGHRGRKNNSANGSSNSNKPIVKKAFGENIKVVLGGVSSVDEVKNAISAADKSFTLAAASLAQTELKHAPVVFSSSESAALAGTVVKEHAPSSVTLRRLPGAVASLPQSLIEHGVSVTVSVLAKAVHAAASEKLAPLRCAVIGAELDELQSAITAALPANSFALFTDVRDFVNHNNSAASSGEKKVAILLLSRALTGSAASQLKLHLVVDSGTERRAQIPPQSEMQFPIKVVLAPTKREAHARKAMAGWCEEGPGIFVVAADFTGSTSNNSGAPSPTFASATPDNSNNNNANDASADAAGTKSTANAAATAAAASTSAAASSSSPARGVDNTLSSPASAAAVAEQEQQMIEGEEDLLEPVCDAVLALAQNGLDLTHLVRDSRRGREAQLALALTFLTDLGFITRGFRSDLVVTTFLGEVCARSGLPPDFACIVINGLAVGMADAATFVATAAARPFRSASHNASGSNSGIISENEFGDTIEDAVTLAEGAAADDVKAYLASRKQGAYPIHAESFESAIRVVKIVQKGIEDFIIPRPHHQQDASSSSPLAVRKQISDNVNLLVAFLAAALARRAVVVRHEGDERINTISRGNLLFTHTAKDVLPNRFLHSGAAWKKDMVMICSSVQNTPTRLLGSGCTGVSNDYFMGCLFALSPFIAFEPAPSNNNVLFSVSLNSLEKTSLVPQQLADQLLKLRDQWKTLMSYVQLRRATGAKTAAHFKELAAKHLDKRFNLENAQAEYVADLCELISDFHVNIPLGSSNIGRDMSRVKSHVLAAPAPPATLTSIAVPGDFATAKDVAVMCVGSAAEKISHDDVTAKKSGVGASVSAAVVADEGSDEDDEEADIIIDDD